MENILPSFKTFSLDDPPNLKSQSKSKKLISATHWQNKGTEKSLPSYLRQDKPPVPKSYESVKPEYQINIQPPNIKYSKPVEPYESQLSGIDLLYKILILIH